MESIFGSVRNTRFRESLKTPTPLATTIRRTDTNARARTLATASAIATTLIRDQHFVLSNGDETMFRLVGRDLLFDIGKPMLGSQLRGDVTPDTKSD
jgi:hypothetical protein